MPALDHAPGRTRRRLKDIRPGQAAVRAADHFEHRLEGLLGGRARTRVVVLLACVLGLENADQAAIGAAAPQLQSSLHVSVAAIGLVAAISTFVGALGTIPAGVLTDRVRRVNLLIGALALWAVAMAFSAAASNFEWLLLSRLGLGAVTAAAGPTIASLTGDYFPPGERGKIYGYILSGELVGAGVGFVVSGSVASALSWRGAFAVLVIPAIVLAYLIWRHLPEPARGGQSRLAAGGGSSSNGGSGAETELARKQVVRQEVDAHAENVLHRDPARLRLREAVRYVLKVRTNVWLIAASTMGYFFFAGLRTFGLSYVRGHFGLGQAAGTIVLFLAGVGSLAGVLLAGRLADRLIRRGRLDGRVLVGAIAYLIAGMVLAPGILFGSLLISLPLLMIGAAALSAPNPPLDAARLDVMPSGLWGRAEGVRTLIRQSGQAGAPLLFGVLADLLAGGAGNALGSQSGGTIPAATANGLQWAFVIMLVPLLATGVILLRARRDYPADVATAVASEAELG